MRLPSSPTRVLVVHRNLDFAPRIRRHLGSLANVALTFSTALTDPAADGDGPDVVLLDLTAQIPDGFDLHRLIQPHAGTLPPVLMLRSRPPAGAPSERRPDGIVAVESRLRTALGRFPHRAPEHALRFTGAHLAADLPNGHVVVDGTPVAVSQREAELLAVLLAHCNRVVSRPALFAEIWGYETRALDVYVRRLRRKLRSAGAQLETVVALGYRFLERGPYSLSTPAEGAGGGGPEITSGDIRDRKDTTTWRTRR